MYALNCAPCTRAGKCRLGFATEEYLGVDERRSHASVTCPPEYEGMVGFAHGGWVASVLDETLGHIAIHHGGFAVTARLEVDFIRPVPVARLLVARAELLSHDGTRLDVAGSLEFDGMRLAAAVGTWISVDPAKHAVRNSQLSPVEVERPSTRVLRRGGHPGQSGRGRVDQPSDES